MFDALNRYVDIYYLHFPKEKELIDVMINRKIEKLYIIYKWTTMIIRRSLILHNIKIVE